jgi:hypothetical protein
MAVQLRRLPDSCGGIHVKRIIMVVTFLVAAMGIFAQDITLPRPGDKSGVDLLRAIQNRRVARAFVKRDVPVADLSTMLWAGLGPRGVDAISSATTSGRTISFSGDNPYINIYVLNDKGTYRYLPDKNTLKFIGGTDMRDAVSRAAVPDAAVMLLFTADTALTPSFLKGNPALFLQMAHATAGFSAQNIALTASTFRMAAIVQYTLAAAEAVKAAALGKDEVPLFIMQVGYTE